MIPLIRKLMLENHAIIFGGNRWQNELISNEIKGITCIFFPGFSIRYSSFLPQFVIILFYYPLFVYHSFREHFMLKKIINRHHPDIIISDSRIGLWNRKIKSVLVTHIIRVPFPRPFRMFENLMLPLSRAVIKRFTYCFIPDFPGEINLSGRLSHQIRLPENARYIGILSRFKGITRTKSSKGATYDSSTGHTLTSEEDFKKDIFCTAIMSGPSPQKELLTSKIKDLLLKLNKNSVILAGNPSGGYAEHKEGNVRIINNLPNCEIASTIRRSEIIISRSGYTTVMELFSLGRSAILIPTPGQPEQEYLAEYLSEKKWFVRIKQKALSIKSLSEFKNPALPAFNEAENNRLFQIALKELLEE